MALSGPASYVSTTEEFLAHWQAANTTLGAGNEVVLQGGVGRAQLLALYNALVAKRLDLAAKLNIEETSRGDVETGKASVLLRLNQFNELVRADFGGTKWERALPHVPSFSDGAGVFTPPLDDASTLWLQLNADPGTTSPLLLLGGYAQATFAADVASLKAAFAAWRAAQVVASIALQERNEIQDQIQPVLVGYRKKLPTQVPKGHSLVTSLPNLTPAPGSTPDAVIITGSWDPLQHQARITYNFSSSPNVLRYELRFCSGPDYNTDLENVVSSNAPDVPGEFLTDAGLTSAGNVASYKVYVINTTGNERGSNAVPVTRLVPGGPGPLP